VAAEQDDYEIIRRLKFILRRLSRNQKVSRKAAKTQRFKGSFLVVLCALAALRDKIKEKQQPWVISK